MIVIQILINRILESFLHVRLVISSGLQECTDAPLVCTSSIEPLNVTSIVPDHFLSSVDVDEEKKNAIMLEHKNIISCSQMPVVSCTIMLLMSYKPVKTWKLLQIGKSIKNELPRRIIYLQMLYPNLLKKCY